MRLGRRLIALDLDELVNIQIEVIAAGLPSKIEALHAALSGGLVPVPVTSVDTARALPGRIFHAI
jgi:DNA-binding transcriptional regulator LsrR (DeoR family)